MTRKGEEEKKVDVWMPILIGKYTANTSHLSTEEHGMYFLLMMHAWTHGGAIPGQDHRLRNITRTGPEAWAQSRDTMLAFWDLQSDGTYRQKRLDAELEKAKDFKDKKSKAGKAGARARWEPDGPNDGGADGEGNGCSDGKRDGTAMAEATANGMASECPIPLPKPTPSLRSGVRRAPHEKGDKPTTMPHDFEISPEVRAWAKGKGFESFLDLHLEHFRDYAKGGNGKGQPPLALDWDAKFRNCIRSDWGDVRRNAQRAIAQGRGASGVPVPAWRPGAEPAEVLKEAARKLQIDPWQEGETQGQFRARIVAEPGGEELLKPPRFKG
jgi:uncharacterized protein YdaU (DUF1376 family)